MIPEESLRALVELSGLVLSQDDPSSTQDAICRIAVRALPNAEGSSITTIEATGPTASAASDDWARDLDERQYEEHEGPCLDCVRTGAVFRIRDLAEDTRWPSYGPRAVEVGARSVMSLPLNAEGRRWGALNVYSRQPDAFDAEAATIGEIVAAHASTASQVAAAFFHHRDLGEQLREAMKSRETIAQATGILMGTRGLQAEPAFKILVELSQHTNTKLRDVAAALIEQTVGSAAATG